MHHGSVGEIDAPSGPITGADEVSVWPKVPHRSAALFGKLDRITSMVRGLGWVARGGGAQLDWVSIMVWGGNIWERLREGGREG